MIPVANVDLIVNLDFLFCNMILRTRPEVENKFEGGMGTMYIRVQIRFQCEFIGRKKLQRICDLRQLVDVWSRRGDHVDFAAIKKSCGPRIS